MAAATNDRNTLQRPTLIRYFLIEAATLIWSGTIACVNASGRLTKGATSATLKCVGVARSRYDNSAGAAGAIGGETELGVFGPFANSASTDQITLADVGSDCYIVDDQTVAKTNGSNTRSVAGKVYDVETAGVWVRFS